MMVTTGGEPMVENISTFMGDQKFGVDDLSFVKVVFISEMEMCFISDFLLAQIPHITQISASYNGELM